MLLLSVRNVCKTLFSVAARLFCASRMCIDCLTLFTVVYRSRGLKEASRTSLIFDGKIPLQGALEPAHVVVTVCVCCGMVTLCYVFC